MRQLPEEHSFQAGKLHFYDDLFFVFDPGEKIFSAPEFSGFGLTITPQGFIIKINVPKPYRGGPPLYNC